MVKECKIEFGWPLPIIHKKKPAATLSFISSLLIMLLFHGPSFGQITESCSGNLSQSATFDNLATRTLYTVGGISEQKFRCTNCSWTLSRMNNDQVWVIQVSGGPNDRVTAPPYSSGYLNNGSANYWRLQITSGSNDMDWDNPVAKRWRRVDHSEGTGTWYKTISVSCPPWVELSENTIITDRIVGIGTSTPQAQLDVLGDVRFDGEVHFHRFNERQEWIENSKWSGLPGGGPGTGYGLAFHAGGSPRMWIYQDGNIAVGDLGSLDTTPGSDLEVIGDMKVTGTLGIGTSSTPQAKLHVVGSPIFEENGKGFQLGGTTSNYSFIAPRNNSQSRFQSELKYYYGTQNWEFEDRLSIIEGSKNLANRWNPANSLLQLRSGSQEMIMDGNEILTNSALGIAANGNIHFRNHPGDGNPGTDLMMIDQNGNVGIGTGSTTPSSKLEVKGDIQVSGTGKFVGDGSLLTSIDGGAISSGEINGSSSINTSGDIATTGSIKSNDYRSFDGTLVIDSSGKWVGDPTGLVGPRGPKGDQGSEGAQGDTGDRGPRGNDGSCSTLTCSEAGGIAGTAAAVAALTGIETEIVGIQGEIAGIQGEVTGIQEEIIGIQEEIETVGTATETAQQTAEDAEAKAEEAKSENPWNKSVDNTYAYTEENISIGTISNNGEKLLIDGDTKSTQKIIAEKGFEAGSNGDKFKVDENGDITTGVFSTNTSSSRSITSITTDLVQMGNSALPSGMLDFQLYVDKGIATESYLITNPSSWSDFVFDKDYQLKGLDEVAEYIAENGHLPDVPSEAEIIERKYYEQHELNKVLLQKIEELTLYMIEQDKTLKKQQAMLQELKELGNK